MQDASTLEMKQIFSSPYYSHDNGHIKIEHNFLKMCIQKHVSSEPAWDEVTNILCSLQLCSK